MLPIAADLSFQAHSLVSSPALVTLVRARVIQTTTSVDEAAFRLVAITRSISAEIEAQFAKQLDKINEEIDELNAKIKALKEEVRTLEEQIKKLERMKETIEKLLPALKAAVAADQGTQIQCKPTQLVVSVRTTKLLRVQSEAEATMAQLGPRSDLDELLARLRRLIEQMPVLFDIPGLH